MSFVSEHNPESGITPILGLNVKDQPHPNWNFCRPWNIGTLMYMLWDCPFVGQNARCFV